MESHGKQQARKVLRRNGTGTKEAQQRNTRMGKAGCRHRQNLGGVVKGLCLYYEA